MITNINYKTAAAVSALLLSATMIAGNVHADMIHYGGFEAGSTVSLGLPTSMGSGPEM